MSYCFKDCLSGFPRLDGNASFRENFVDSGMAAVFLPAGCPCCHPSNSLGALIASSVLVIRCL